MDKVNNANEIIKIAKEVFTKTSDSIDHTKYLINEEFLKAVYLIYNSSDKKIIITGVGKSGIIGKKISATLSSTGVLSYFLHPTDALHGDLGVIKDGDIILALSDSGETQELLHVLEAIKNIGLENKVISITSNKHSKLAKISDISIQTYVVPELSGDENDFSFIPTTSATVTLAMGDAISIVLQKLRNFQKNDFLKFHPGGNLGKKIKKDIKKI